MTVIMVSSWGPLSHGWNVLGEELGWAEIFARGSPVYGRSCLKVTRLLRCWCPFWVGPVPPDCLMSYGSRLGRGCDGLRGMTGEADFFARDLPVLGRSYLGGPQVLQCWWSSCSRMGIGVCLVRYGDRLFRRGDILKPLEG